MMNRDYETDFYAWVLHNAQLLRERRWSEIDVEHLIEELESMGKNNQRELNSRFKILLAQLLKWQYQPEHRSKSWQRSIDEQRSELDDLIEENPSLTTRFSHAVANAYPKAVKLAVKETRLSLNTFPQKCPYLLEQILDENFYPEGQQN